MANADDKLNKPNNFSYSLQNVVIEDISGMHQANEAASQKQQPSFLQIQKK